VFSTLKMVEVHACATLVTSWKKRHIPISHRAPPWSRKKSDAHRQECGRTADRFRTGDGFRCLHFLCRRTCFLHISIKTLRDFDFSIDLVGHETHVPEVNIKIKHVKSITRSILILPYLSESTSGWD